MRKFITLMGGVFMMLAMNVQAAEMQHDGHGQMMDMSAKAQVIEGLALSNASIWMRRRSPSIIKRSLPLAGQR
ncbi:Uncharacterised protein [Kluyvera cryocrescens]|nr:Uncharacterised protein [Kluyvera cryocrescens]